MASGIPKISLRTVAAFSSRSFSASVGCANALPADDTKVAAIMVATRKHLVITL
jgi:hypothetical protein